MEFSLLCAGSSGLALKDFVPILIAVFVFVANVIYQEINKRNNTRDRIATEVISTCDKMIRYAFEAEYSVLMWKYWTKVVALYPLTTKGNEEENKHAKTEVFYYHRKLEDAGIKLDLLRSELKKSVKDLQNCWKNELEKQEIIKLMAETVIKEPRRFENKLNTTYTSFQQLTNDCNELLSKVSKEVIFDGLGFDLVRIQKIIDPKSPTLLLSHEDEIKLIEKIAKEKRKRQVI